MLMSIFSLYVLSTFSWPPWFLEQAGLFSTFRSGRAHVFILSLCLNPKVLLQIGPSQCLHLASVIQLDLGLFLCTGGSERFERAINCSFKSMAENLKGLFWPFRIMPWLNWAIFASTVNVGFVSWEKSKVICSGVTFKKNEKKKQLIK